MKSRLISALALVAFCVPALAANFDDNYKVYSGDLNGDGLTDVYVKHEAQVILIPFDDGLSIPIVKSDTHDLVDEVVLQNNGNGSFTQIAVSTLSASDRGRLAGWRTKAGSLMVGDFNLDGAYDAYLDLPPENFTGQVNDVVLYSPVGAGAPAAQGRVDSDFSSFFDQLDKWVKNPNYFTDNAPTVTQVRTVTGFLWLPEYCANQAWVDLYGPLENQPPIQTIVASSLAAIYAGSQAFLSQCASRGENIVHYDYVSVQYQTVVGTKDYSGFNQAALALAQGALKEVIDAGGVTSGSSNAKKIADVFERILHTTILGGGLRDPSVITEDDQDVDVIVTEHRRLRWLQDLCELLSYLSEQGSPRNQPPGTPVLMTFDDGPTQISDLLKITAELALENIKADFYVIGKDVAPNAAQTAALIPLGHKVQNHTWDHPGKGLNPPTPLTQMTQAQVNAEVSKAQDAILAATGVAAKRFRCPQGVGCEPGRVDPKVKIAMAPYGLTAVYWDVDTHDWQAKKENGKKVSQGLNAQTIANSLLQAKAHATRASYASPIVILMHVRTNTAKGLLPFIEVLRKAGFTFVNPG